MSSLLITRNGTTLMHASTGECCSLDWHVACSRREQEFGHFMVSGLIARSDDKCDFVHWLENVVLDAGDELTVQMLPGAGITTILKRQTYEEHEALRQEVMRAEAAGEYDAARDARPELQRGRCGISLLTPDRIFREVRAIDPIEATLCSGSWTDLRPKEWRLRLWSMPAEPTAAGFWQPIEGGVQMKILD